MAGKHKPRSLADNSGMALITALIFIIISVVVMTSMMARYVQQRLQVDRFEDYYCCFEGAEAGVVQCRIARELGETGIIGIDENWVPQFDHANRLVLPAFDAEVVSPVSFATMPGVEFIGYTLEWYGNGRDMNGDGIVDSEAERRMYSIHTASRHNGIIRRLEVVYAAYNANPWGNAIFAGSGQEGRVVNGNVSIHGSVHILGDHVPEGGLAINALDLTGTSLLANNYGDRVNHPSIPYMPDHLRMRVPALPTRMHEGTEVETLNARLRVKKGLVALSGNSRIGMALEPGMTIKNTMDGVYVTDGWEGGSAPTNVWSDNGVDNVYDLGHRGIVFPTLDMLWVDPVTLENVENPHTGDWYTHDEYFTEVLLADPVIRDDGIYEGDITINARTGDHFYWNATTEEELTGADALAATPGENDDYLQFNADTNVLSINGQIRINGDLTFEGQGSSQISNTDRLILYSGRAALLVDGNVKIGTHLITCNNNDPSDTANSFPQNNIIGIMATQDMEVGLVSQLSLMGAFYAAGRIKSSFQSVVAGTFVANYFDMGSQVPRIFQVPELQNWLPYGMIGHIPILVMDRTAWREIGIA